MTRARLLAGLGLAAVVAFYAWTMATSTDTDLRGGRIDPYNLTASAILDGRLDLPIAVPPALRALKDPYDPAQRGSILSSDLQDLSYYDGRLYAYWGPVPALVAFVPFRALGLGDLPPGFAVLAFVVVGFAASLALARWLGRAFAPRAPGWMLAVGGAVLALASTGPYLLRRPAQYEVALSAGYAFAMLGLWLLLSGALARERPSWRRLAAGSLCVGLAFGSRPPLAIAIVVALGLLWWCVRSPRGALALLGPFAACVAAYLAYNVARFGAPLEFGQGVQLAGIDPSLQHPSASYTLPGLWYQLVEPPRLRVQFPYLQLGPPPGAPFAVPADYDNVEPTGGLLACSPFLLLALAAPWVLRGRGRAIAGALVGMALVLVLFVTTSLPSTTQRYQMDFVPLLALAAIAGWLALARRRAIAVGGAVLAAWTVLVAVAVSFTGPKGTLAATHPGEFRALEDVTSPLPTLAAQIAGHPIIASLNLDTSLGPRRYDTLGIAGGGADAGPRNVLRIVAPRAGNATVSMAIVGAQGFGRIVPTLVADGGGSAVGRRSTVRSSASPSPCAPGSTASR